MHSMDTTMALEAILLCLRRALDTPRCRIQPALARVAVGMEIELLPIDARNRIAIRAVDLLIFVSVQVVIAAHSGLGVYR